MTRPDGGRLVIVSGLPGAGKTTLARRIERAYPGVRFCPDEWLFALGIDQFDAEARTRVEGLQWTQARRVLELGGTAILEWGTWARAERVALGQRARRLGAAVELHFLDAPIDVLWARVRARDAGRRLGRRPLTREDLVIWAAELERPADDELGRFDPPAMPLGDLDPAVG